MKKVTRAYLHSPDNAVVARGCDLAGDDRLHWLLGRLVHAFGRLDLTIGLQLRWPGLYRGVDVAGLLTAETKFKTRAKKLRSLVGEMWGHSNEAAREAFDQWFERVERVRALRNNYAHGRWGNASAKDLNYYQFVALSWEFDAERQPPAEYLSLDELEVQVKEVETLFNDFKKLTRKYETEGRWSKAYEDQHGSSPNAKT